MLPKKLYLLFVLFSAGCFGQSVKQELVNINKAYYANTSYMLTIDVKCFKESNTKPISDNKTVVYKAKDKYLYKTESSENMVNADYKVTIDHKRKLMVVSKAGEKNSNKKQADLSIYDKKETQMEFDSVLSHYKLVELKKVNDKTNGISFEFKAGQYTKAFIEYDKKTYEVTKMEFYTIQTDPKTKLTQEYKYVILQNYSHNKNIDKTVFDSSNYFTIKNTEPVGVNKYAGYEIINYLKR
jgi:hypothetical protein